MVTIVTLIAAVVVAVIVLCAKSKTNERVRCSNQIRAESDVNCDLLGFLLMRLAVGRVAALVVRVAVVPVIFLHYF